MTGKNLENGEEMVSNSSSNERMKEMSIDRLSALPDEILIHILSFLGVDKSVVTSVLSKRWEFLWTELPRLEFRQGYKERDKTREFVAMVNRTLLIRIGTLLEICVDFWYDECFASDVDSWLYFAVNNKVKEVCLHLRFVYEDEFYGLPEMMYSNSSLTRFTVRGCIMDTRTKIEWRSLTRLEMKYSRLPQHVIENILAGCPVLNTLDLEDCLGFNCLDVKSPNLYEIRVFDRPDGQNGPLLEISAPYVHILNIFFNPDMVKLVLKNIKSLVTVKINITEQGMELDTAEGTMDKLFEMLKDVKDLKLGGNIFEVLSMLILQHGYQLRVSRRKCLTVTSFYEDEQNVHGLYALLKFSPYLERLAIKGFETDCDFWDDGKIWDLGFDLLHLKTVTITVAEDSPLSVEPMLAIVRTLLKRATALEEMTIRPGVRELNDHIKVSEALLSYPRSSAKAVIRLG